MLPWVCSVIDYRWRQNFVKTNKWHTSRRRVCHCCFYHILTSSVIYYWPFIWYYWSFNKPDLKRGSKALCTDSKNSLRLMRSAPEWLRQTLLLAPERLCMRVYRMLSQTIVFFAYFYRDMVNNKRCSWEECERDSRIPERVVWVTK